ncbi:MAG: hypothetical protein R2695_21950 [Acidimicrobiales bacterium]
MISQALAINHPAKVRACARSCRTPATPRAGGGALSLVARSACRRKPPARRPSTRRSGSSGRSPVLHFDETRFRALTQAGIDRSFCPDGTARQTAAIGASPDRTARLGGVRVPRSRRPGLVDTLVKPSGGIATASRPSSRLLMLPDMGHDLPRPRWAELRRDRDEHQAGRGPLVRDRCPATP